MNKDWKQFGKYWVIYLLACTGVVLNENHLIFSLIAFFIAGFMMSTWSDKTEK